MAIRITNEQMTSDTTRHIAWARDNGDWGVTWLPQSSLSRNQAVTAMTIAEHVDAPPSAEWNRMSGHIDGWAAELGLSGADAITEASLSPEEHGTEPPVQEPTPYLVHVELERRIAELEMKTEERLAMSAMVVSERFSEHHDRIAQLEKSASEIASRP